MTRSFSAPGAVDASARQGIDAVGDDPESLARLQKTVMILAHVHTILVRLRARAEDAGDVDGIKQ
jgi:hypothetical protein